MGNSVSVKNTGDPAIIEAKSLLSNGDEAGAFAVLKEAARKQSVMARYDCGFMMIQGIGREKDEKAGMELMQRGRRLEEESEDMSWKSNGSVSELYQGLTMDLDSLYRSVNSDLNNHISF